MFIHLITLNVNERKLQGKIDKAKNIVRDFKTPLRVTLVDGLVKFLLNVVLLSIPNVNISGAALATAVSNLFGAFYVRRLLKKRYGLNFTFAKIAFPSLISASISSLAAYYAYSAFAKEFPLIISIAAAGLCGALLYCLILYISDSREFLYTINVIRNKNTKKPCKMQGNIVK